MGYCHRMSASFIFHPGVTNSQIYDAFKPLSDYWDAPVFDLKTIRKDGNDLYVATIETEGDVGYDYDDIVQECAQNLKSLCKPDFFEIHDDETVDAEEMVKRIWVGEPQAVEDAKRAWAWKEAMNTLANNGYVKSEIESLYEMSEYWNERRQNNRNQKLSMERCS